MEDEGMVVLLVLYLRENGLCRVLARVHSPAKLEAYVRQVQKMLEFCPAAAQAMKTLEFNIN